jgi:hypothetical protein
MSTHLDLPGDHWAEIKDPMDITVDEAQPLKARFLSLGRELNASKAPVGSVAATGALHPIAGGPSDPAPAPALDDDSLSDDKIAKYLAFGRQSMAFFIEKWDFGFEPSGENLGKIPVPVYDKLDEHIAPLIGQIIPELKPKDKETPTTP